MKRRSLNQAMLLWPLFSQLSKTAVKHRSAHPIGMGTWITFDHRLADIDQAGFVRLLNAFFAGGGQMIDSSPMYGYAQQLLGQLLPLTHGAKSLFSATKVWTMGQQMGELQMRESMRLWGLSKINLMYVHNLLDWQVHLPTLKQWQQQGLIDHIGVTTSHGRRHRELIRVMQQQPIDYVQFSYNIHDREAEQYLLPVAREQGIKVVINRPFQTGGLFTRVAGKPLPRWAAEIGCQHWAQFFLKFIVSHPAVHCAIPATSQVSHMQQNMKAGLGPMPDDAMRQEMVSYWRKMIA
ncbi:aldo/keto reductase [Marinicella sediminis]|uniref:Aldo/keto reductase n=1 Tax=Marinicella sediminis TaxID=1792834 RepID=A0ABV7JEC7_9GAMM|nr:aldo/keto reductase [Marinicella sediminis]